MSKDGTTRGGQRHGAGRKPKAVTEKYANGNPGGRKLTVMDFGDTTEALQGVEMPPRLFKSNSERRNYHLRRRNLQGNLELAP